MTIKTPNSEAMAKRRVATLATAALVFMLSRRLRQRERLTLFKLGAARSTTTQLLLAEVVAVIIASMLLAALLTFANKFITGILAP